MGILADHTHLQRGCAAPAGHLISSVVWDLWQRLSRAHNVSGKPTRGNVFYKYPETRLSYSLGYNVCYSPQTAHRRFTAADDRGSTVLGETHQFQPELGLLSCCQESAPTLWPHLILSPVTLQTGTMEVSSQLTWQGKLWSSCIYFCSIFRGGSWPPGCLHGCSLEATWGHSLFLAISIL